VKRALLYLTLLSTMTAGPSWCQEPGAPPADEASEKSMRDQLARQTAQQDYTAYLAGLRAAAKIEINKAILEKKGG